MVEDYLTWETRFLVPLVLAVAVFVYRRDEAEEIRCLWLATGIAVGFVGLNSLLVSQARLGLPASIAFGLLVTAYAIWPAIRPSLLAAAIGGVAACAAAAARLAAAGLPFGLEEGHSVDIPALIAAAAAGLATTAVVQWGGRRLLGRVDGGSLADL
ncbi:MAG: hypothetical protein RLZZ440_1148 [Planctomycetota bacterium]|jgi:hypothetical protein